MGDAETEITTRPKRSYLIDKLFPSREVHLIGGVSGSGKSRWLFDTVLDWEKGIPILGQKSNPIPWVYVASDRSIESVWDTLETMGINPDEVPTIPAFGAHKKSFGAIIDEISKVKAQLAIIEGFGKFADPPANGWQVAEFLSNCSALTAPSREFPQGLTIWGVMESPKLKPFEKYDNPRQRISGVAAWAHFSETIVLIEHENPKDLRDPHRAIYICPRNLAAIQKKASFDAEGHLRFSDGILSGM
jgi:hypothetical protein